MKNSKDFSQGSIWKNILRLAEPVSNFIGGSACFITMIMTVWRKLPADSANVLSDIKS